MSQSALSASFEYLCYGSTVITPFKYFNYFSAGTVFDVPGRRKGGGRRVLELQICKKF